MKPSPVCQCGSVNIYCKASCRLCYDRAWRAANGDKIAGQKARYLARNGLHGRRQKRTQYYGTHSEQWRHRQLLRDYGIGLPEYKAMLESQGGVCKVCGKPPGAKDLAVDHCHSTGRIRGLLCKNCNVALGLFNDDCSLLDAAKSYLKENGL